MVKENSSGKTEKITKRSLGIRTTDVDTPAADNDDIYTKVIAFEEAEAKRRNADDDAKVYISTCDEIGNLLKEIAELRSKNGEGSSVKIKEKQIQVTTRIILLKKLNRLEKVRTLECRLALQKYREQVDKDHLQLQNLVYEHFHLSKEVTKCYEFKSLDEDMNLIPIEDFYATAPASVSKPELTKENAHELKLARLTWELMQRKELSLQIKKLDDTKKVLAKEIDEKKEQLNSLEPNLQAIIDATKPLQDTLGVSVSKMQRMTKLAGLLPRPLYTLHVQADALSRLCKWLSASIVGKADEVRSEEQHFDDISSDSDSDGEKESSRRRKKTHERRRSGPAAAEQRREECLRRHPLSVAVNIALPSGSVNLQFHWLTTLEIICVLPTVSASAGIAVADFLSSDNVLSALFIGDTGETLPNPSGYYHLQRAGLDRLPSIGNTLGTPYNWAQTLCGLKYLTDSFSVDVEICKQNLEETLRAVRKRILNRIALAREIKLLESREVFQDLQSQCTLTSFTSIAEVDVQGNATVSRLVDAGLIDNLSLLYRACVSLSDIRITAYIALSPNYPSVLPVFALEIAPTKSTTFTALNSGHVRDIERELNTVKEATYDGDNFLINQVHKLFRCCEVFVSTESLSDKTSKAAVFRPIQGRMRCHPYRYIDSAGGIFTYR